MMIAAGILFLIASWFLMVWVQLKFRGFSNKSPKQEEFSIKRGDIVVDMIPVSNLNELKNIYTRMNSENLANLQLPKLNKWIVFRTQNTEVAIAIERLIDA